MTSKEELKNDIPEIVRKAAEIICTLVEEDLKSPNPDEICFPCRMKMYWREEGFDVEILLHTHTLWSLDYDGISKLTLDFVRNERDLEISEHNYVQKRKAFYNSCL